MKGGRPLQFGISIDPNAADFAEGLRLAERPTSFASTTCRCRFTPNQPAHLDVWTMLTYQLARTDRIAVLPNVLDLQLRPPTLIANAAASLVL